MAPFKLSIYPTIVNYLFRSGRKTVRSYATATTSTTELERTDQPARAFHLYTKSHIASLFTRYAPQLDPLSYLAASQVFPMRANNYVVEDLIDWSVSKTLHLS